jgi:phospholipase C
MARKRTWVVLAFAVVVAAVTAQSAHKSAREARGDTVTPMQHLVVIFGENISFDHYFGTYPDAANTDGQTFHAAAGAPAVNGLSGTLLSAFRMGRTRSGSIVRSQGNSRATRITTTRTSRRRSTVG